MGGNPISYNDRDGLVIDTPFDLLNVALGTASAVANISQGNYGAAAVDALGVAIDIAAAATPGVPGGAATAIKAARCAESSASIWSSTKKLTPVKNAFEHRTKHKSEFPEFANAKQYVEGTKKFLNNSPTGTLIKTRSNGDILKYHPATNTFGVMNASGTSKTMFRPTDGVNYWSRQ